MLPFLGRIQSFVVLGWTAFIAVCATGVTLSGPSCKDADPFICVAGTAIAAIVITGIFGLAPAYILAAGFNWLSRKSDQIAAKAKTPEPTPAPVERVFIAPPASAAPAPTETPAPSTTESAAPSISRASTKEFVAYLKAYLAS